MHSIYKTLFENNHEITVIHILFHSSNFQWISSIIKKYEWKMLLPYELDYLELKDWRRRALCFV